jgi:hypothetical protein
MPESSYTVRTYASVARSSRPLKLPSPVYRVGFHASMSALSAVVIAAFPVLS